MANNTALRFGIDDGGQGRSPDLNDECFFRIELSDGREALVMAQHLGVQDGALIAATNDRNVLALAPGTWCSFYLCEALMAVDPVAIIGLPAPKTNKARNFA